MCTYRAEREFTARFPARAGGISSVTEYLDHCGARFSDVFNIHAYLGLSRSIDEHHVNPASIGVPLDLVGFSTDQIVSPEQLFELRSRLRLASTLKIIDSQYGHDAFLVETGAVAKLIRRHLESSS